MPDTLPPTAAAPETPTEMSPQGAPVPGPVDAAEAAATAPAVPELTPAQCAARLAAMFPALFAPPVKPIKLRIQADLQERAPGVFTRRVLSAFLHRHTTSTAYLKALVHLGQRFDLDGAPAGEIAAEHREAAVTELSRRRAIVNARHEAERLAQRQSQRDADKTQREADKVQHEAQQAEERQRREAFAAQDQTRRERIALLRAWEGSTLTRANFCTLKRIDESTLDAQLALAREDLAQRAVLPGPAPAPPARPARGGGHHAPRR